MVVVPGPNPHGRSQVIILQAASTADGDGLHALVSDYGAYQHITVEKTGTGTANVAFEGSDDETAWEPIPYQQVDITPAGAESVANLALGAGTVTHTYKLNQEYSYVRARQNGTAGSVILTAILLAQAAGGG